MRVHTMSMWKYFRTFQQEVVGFSYLYLIEQTGFILEANRFWLSIKNKCSFRTAVQQQNK